MELSQVSQRDFVFACIDVGTSELCIVDVIVRIMRIKLEGFLQKRNSLLVLADDVEFGFPTPAKPEHCWG